MARNDIDRIIKENFIPHLLEVFKVFLGIEDCEPDREMRLPGGKIHGTVERDPDYVEVMKRPNGERFILHIEFQTTNDPDMVYRVQEYHALLQRKVKLPIVHHVLYLGEGESNMQSELDPTMIYTGFELTNTSDYDSETLLESSVPEEVLMAVLGNFGKEKPVELVRKILERLQELSGNRTKLRKYLYQLTILSRLRNLENETIEQTENMPIVIDIERDGLYQRGMAKGIEKGIEKGMEKGIEKGMEKAKEEKLRNARKLKQSGVAINVIAQSLGLTAEEVKKL